jgi:hypothetical protein
VVNQYALRTQIAADLPAIIKVLKDKALDGDTTAARVLLDRSLSPLKPTDDPIKVTLGATPADSARLVLEAVGQGELTPDQGGQLLGALAAQARIIETSELLSRIERLEQSLAVPTVEAP